MSAGALPPLGPRAALRRGLQSPNLLIVAYALLVAVVALLGLQWVFTSGRFTAVAEARFLRMTRDDWGHVSWQVGELKVHPPTKPAVYLLGGSNVRECIQSEAALQQAISAQSGIDTEVHDLGSTNQHLGESMAIVDNLPPDSGVVVIGVNHTRFSYTPDEVAQQIKGRELLLRSPALRHFVASHGGPNALQVTILPGILNYLSGWAQKNERALASGRLPVNRYLPHRYFQGYQWSSAKKRSRVDQWVENRGAPGGDFDQNFAYNADLLEALAVLAKQRGLTVVLQEVPENRQIVGDSFDRYRQVYQPFCRDLAARYGGYYVDFGDQIGLVDNDFRDLTHLVESGRAKWTPALAGEIGPILQQTNEGEAGS